MAESSGITTRRFKSGSIIYFDGDRSDYIYILKSGRVILTSIKLDTREQVTEDVKIGEFFGVKSVLGKYPREETAQTIGETTVLVLRPADFERLILKNVTIVRKMLRVFSNQLRRIHGMVRHEMGEEENINPVFELFNIGEYYYKTGIYQQALYAYKKFMEHYPDTEYAPKAMQRIREIETGEIEKPAPASSSADSMSELFGTEEVTAADGISAEPESVKLSDDLNDFLEDGKDLPDFGDFDMDTDASGTEKTPADLLADADALFGQGNFADAENLYGQVSDSPESDDSLKAMASVGKGRCCAGQKKIKEAIIEFNSVIKNYSSAPAVKNAVFETGKLLFEAGQKDKAVMYLKKAAVMSPKDSVTEEALRLYKQING